MPVQTDKSRLHQRRRLQTYSQWTLKVPKFQGMPNNSLALYYLLILFAILSFCVYYSFVKIIVFFLFAKIQIISDSADKEKCQIALTIEQ